jgi:hypothetical protein
MFASDYASQALEHDVLRSSHPLSLGRPIQQLQEVDNLFDEVGQGGGEVGLQWAGCTAPALSQITCTEPDHLHSTTCQALQQV